MVWTSRACDFRTCDGGLDCGGNFVLAHGPAGRWPPMFGFIFAVNSSVHSYLILALGSTDRITRDVGLYYMANAAGWLIGTLLSGLSFQQGGLLLCLSTAGAMALAN